MEFYSDESVSIIDDRAEFSNVLRGNVQVTAQGRYVILRRLSNTQCVCWDPTTGGVKGSCPYCQGEGWQFTEDMVLMYIAMGVAPVYKPGYLANGQYPQSEMGNTDPNRSTGYCEWTVFPNYEIYSNNTKLNFDSIYELKVAPEGGVYYPLTRVAKWKLLTVTPLHGDYGRVDFFELSLDKVNF